MTACPNLSLPYIVSGQSQPEIPHNSALNILDTLVCGTVLDRDAASPPTSTEGDRYIVGPSASGAWTGKEGYVAARLGGQWNFFQPKNGWSMFVDDEKAVVRYDGTSWKSSIGESIVALRDAAGGSALALATSWTTIGWDTQDRYYGGTTGAPFGHDVSFSNHQITLVEAGDYLVEADVGFRATTISAVTIARARLTLGGTEVPGSLCGATVPVLTNAEVSLSIRKVITATAGQILVVEAQKSVSGTTISTHADHSRVVVRKI